MSNIDSETLDWAARCYADGRPLEFIASVLEVKQKLALKLIRNHVRPTRETAFATAEEVFARIENDGELHQKRGPKPQPIADMAALFERRKALLRRRYARHWDQIWFLRSQHMSGRTLRAIYGDECLIWSVGGGIDGEVS